MADNKNEFSVVDFFESTLNRCGYKLDTRSRILDFGCGSGKYVYEFRDRGYDAYGFEIQPIIEYRSEEDKKYFRVLPTMAESPVDYHYDWNVYRIPFEDDTFDFIYSMATFEHVQNYDKAFSELHRIMKPGSVSIHSFPPKYAWIEPHIRVPFGSAITSFNYYLFWAYLGIRNEFQHDKSPRETALLNYDYAQKGLNYLSPGKILKSCRPYFPSARFAPEIWVNSKMMSLFPPIQYLYTFLKDVVLRLDKK
jgi:SAM-dependent methyltransferase